MNDSISDRFYAKHEIVDVINSSSIKDDWYKDAVNALFNLQRYKLALSLLDFMLEENIFKKQFFRIAINLLNTSYIEKVITKDEGKILADKLKKALSQSPELLKRELNLSLSVFYDDDKGIEENSYKEPLLNVSNTFLGKVADAVRARDIERLRIIWGTSTKGTIHSTPVYQDFLKWIDNDNANAPELLDLFLTSLINTETTLCYELYSTYILPISK